MITGEQKLKFIPICDPSHRDYEVTNAFEKSIRDLFTDYAFYEIPISKDIFEIDLIAFGIKVKIPDLYGWTDVMKITKYTEEKNLVTLRSNNRSVIVNEQDLFPVYDKSINPVYGFHGEIKYSYTLMQIAKMVESNCHKDGACRIINDNNIDEFYDINLSPAGKCNEMYEIITRSRFFNCNGIHLFADDHITLEEAERWKQNSK